MMAEYTLSDFRQSLQPLAQKEHLQRIMQPLFSSPTVEKMCREISSEECQRCLKEIDAIVDSMTPGEREDPEIIDTDRAIRIARGSGSQNRAVLDFLRQFECMKELMAQTQGMRRPPDNFDR